MVDTRIRARRAGGRWLIVVAAALPVFATCSHGGIELELPPVAGTFDYQIGEPARPAPGTDIVDRDHSAQPSGVYDICYVNAFQSQADDAVFWKVHRTLLVRDDSGRPVQDPGWPGEQILDTSTTGNRIQLLAIVGRWIDQCATKGFDAVEPDNLDSWTREGVDGRITRDDNVAFARLLIARAHRHGLAIAQKNTPELSASGTRAAPFDFAIAEECEVFHECGDYTRAYQRNVIEIEYTDNGRAAFARACRARGGTMSILLRDRQVTAPGDAAYVSRTC